MLSRLKQIRQRAKGEGGQALMVVMAFLVIASLAVPPVLRQISTTLKCDAVYDAKTEELYAADAGVEDGIWQVKYDRLQALFGTADYDFDFDATTTYTMNDEINDLTADVTISPVWIPSNVSAPNDSTTAKEIIESNKLMISGSATTTSEYLIKMNFYPGSGEEDQLYVDSVGIWLPHGFHYDGNCNLESNPGDVHYSETVSDHAGGEAVVWEFYSPEAFADIGSYSAGDPLVVDITFDYTSDKPGYKPVSIAWVETSGSVSDILNVTWDIDTKMYQILSDAEGTEVEAYVARCELRDMGDAIAGDYIATGNSLMSDLNNNHFRETLYSSSTAEVTEAPEDGDVIAAYLYWSGWYNGIPVSSLWTDNLSGFDTATPDAWEVYDYSGEDCYRGDGYGVGSYDYADRTLEMVSSYDLSACDPNTVAVSWNMWEDGNLDSNDRLYYYFSGNGGSSWSSAYTAFSNDIGSSAQSFTTMVPDDYLTSQFRFKFYVNDFNDSGDYCYVDNFTIGTPVPDTSVSFDINGDRVYFDGDGDPEVDDWDTEEITASRWDVLENQAGQQSYACFRDVTKLVQAYSDLGDGSNHTGNGEYTVGAVDADPDLADNVWHWAYAGWSLIVVYSSPDTAGHQLYLYDDFAWATAYNNLDFDGDGSGGGTISGFLVPDPVPGESNAAKLTCFVAEGDEWVSGDELWFNGTRLSDGYTTTNVWNSKSIGMSNDGMDIDTFYVTWASGLIEPGATSADLDLQTDSDNWNLIYMILSLRSETTIGGTEHYVIRTD